MAGVLIYSNNPNYLMELQSAAAVIAQGRPVQTLILSGINSADSIKVENLYICRNKVCISDVGVVAELVKQAASQLNCDIVLLSGDRRGKELAGRLAQKMGAGVSTDVSALKVEDGKIIASRNAFGGALVEESIIVMNAQIFAIAPKSFAEAVPINSPIKEIELTIPDGVVELIASNPKSDDAVDIAEADTLLAMGCGFEAQSSIAEVEKIAAKMNAVIGCSKPVATDRKWFSEDRVIGISGKTCKPILAVLMGISGQVQFWAGIREAKTIVAINNDENAPILGMVDYAYVADLKDAVPHLIDKLGPKGL